ncbi:VanZ family protein [Alkalibacillus almallahensis]|uniref:VanZ family protein n=1 Tax=Alkalibacillus almallahensis TaxID=1379154 RepID=UPI0014214D60|nr:VanZ family protein [Alkalibacillus almallahensis]NIK13307.1 VanZ family protein [Alkalibacillus almallahensis]
MRQWTSWLLVILWMALIFYFSHQPGTESSNLSGSVMQVVLNLLPFVSEDTEFIHVLIRKGAHVFVYFVLAILLMNAIRLHHFRTVNRVVLALGVSVLYAASDEYHQTFIDGRAGQVSDVLIDSAGAVLGIGVYLVWKKIRQ